MRALTRSLFAASVITSLLALPLPAAEEEHGLKGGVGFYTQYVFRGLTETDGKPAIQGNIGYHDPIGYYIEGAANNVSVVSDEAQSENLGIVSNSLKMELALGFKGKMEDIGYDVGLVRYQFPGRYPSDFTKPHTTEVYGGVSWNGISLKISNSLGSDSFGRKDAKSYYIDLSGAIPLNDFLSVNLHVGKQKFKGDASAELTYTDYKAELTASFTKEWNAGVGISRTNAKDEAYEVLGKNIGDTHFYGFVKRNF